MGMEYVFVNVTEPKDALQLAKEPEIRAHITRRQWKEIEKRESASCQKKRKFVSIGIDNSEPRNVTDTQVQLTQRPRMRPALAAPPSLPTRQTLPTLPTGPTRSTIPIISIPPQLGGLRVDPFRSYPVPFKPFLPLLVDHC